MSVTFISSGTQDTILFFLICLQLDVLPNTIPFTLRLFNSLLGAVSGCQELHSSVAKKSLYIHLHQMRFFNKKIKIVFYVWK